MNPTEWMNLKKKVWSKTVIKIAFGRLYVLGKFSQIQREANTHTDQLNKNYKFNLPIIQ